MQIFDLNDKQFSEGIFNSGQLSSNSFSIEQDCETTITVSEVPCSYSGQHWIGQECLGTLVNDAHWEISISTLCRTSYDFSAIPPVFVGGGGGGSNNTPSVTAQFFNSLTSAQKNFLNQYAGIKSSIYIFIKSYPSMTTFAKTLINLGIANGTTAIQSFIANWSSLTSAERTALVNYVTSNNNTADSHNFVVWAADYLSGHPDVTLSQFENWFMGTSEGQDGTYNSAYWNNSNLTFTQQALPTWANFQAAFPLVSDPLYDTPQKMYQSIGGDVAALYTGPSTNTCAVRLSKGLNYSGVVIPHIPGVTFKGADNKYYFKSAYEINLWMRKTFGTHDGDPTTPLNLNHYHYTGAQAGTRGVNMPTLLAGKKGIYSLYSSNFQWASGHADLLNSDGTCGNNCHFNDAPIAYIDIWVLQ